MTDFRTRLETNNMTSYADFHRRSIEDRDGFWAEQAQRIEWHTPPTQICDYSNPPFAKWFVREHSKYRWLHWTICDG